MSHTIPSPIDSSGLFWWLKSPHLPALAATIGCLPLLFVHFQQMWVRPHCQYFPLVLAAVAILYHLRRTDPDQEPVQPRPWLAGVALIVGLALSAYAVLRISPLLCYAGWLVSMMAFAFRSQFDAWSSWALLCLIVRLPQGRDVWLIQWLQEITTREIGRASCRERV